MGALTIAVDYGSGDSQTQAATITSITLPGMAAMSISANPESGTLTLMAIGSSVLGLAGRIRRKLRA